MMAGRQVTAVISASGEPHRGIFRNSKAQVGKHLMGIAWMPDSL